jgi:uncharacterized protein YndB with AHSA1/START domain
MNIRILVAFAFLALSAEIRAQTLDPLIHEGAIDAPVEVVWRAWTTNEGLRSWLAPHADIELRVGGTMRTNYDASGDLSDEQTIENMILSFEPHRMLSTRVTKAPADFPFSDAVKEMWTVVYFEPREPGQTLVRVVSMGFTSEPESQAMRAFFDQGNATTIQQMQERLGPIPQ